MSGDTATLERMARKRKDEPPKHPNRSESVALFARLPPRLGKAFMKYLNSLRPQPDKVAVLVTALEDFLESKGFWPGAEDES